MELNRRDVGYTIIARFEGALRQLVADGLSVLYDDYLAGVPSGIVDKARDRLRSPGEEWATPEDFLEDTDFPDLAEVIRYKGSFASYLPGEKIQREEFDERMSELYALRCKIAHSKRVFTTLDLDRLVDHTKAVASAMQTYGEDFLEFIAELESNPEKVVIPTPISFICEADPRFSSLPNNVPTPDYDYEGGFIGREEDIRKVTRLLESDLYRVVTISGAGGVGKTALALKIVEQILAKPANRFDGIVWLSAKETKLTYLGIEEIEPSLKSYEQLLDTISEVMGYGDPGTTVEEKEATVQTIFEMHKCILIIIDNLETITDSNIREFILSTPQSAKILITTRKGLGEVERRHELKQLKEHEAVRMFRLICRDKKLDSLVRLPDDVINVYVNKVALYPLAIKWVIGQVAVGKNIDDVIAGIDETTSDMSLFCFEQTYQGLEKAAKLILCALSVFDETPSAGVLKYVADIDQHDFEDGIQDLILRSLVIPEYEESQKESVIVRYTLLSLTRGYVRQQLDKDRQLKSAILERLQTVHNVVEEAERAKKQYRFSLANLGAETEEEKVAAMIAQTAFQKYQAGNYAGAVSDYKRAIEIVPRFASLYRNWAVMEAAEGHAAEAEQLIARAADLNPDDLQIWLTWGTIKRKQDRVKEALEKYEKAYSLAPNDSIVLNNLGQAKSRWGEYEEADRLFRAALNQKAPVDTVRHGIINLCSLADNLHRWAEDLIRGRDYDSARKKLEEAHRVCERAAKLDDSDTKSADLLRKIRISLGVLCSRTRDPLSAVSYFEWAIADTGTRSMRPREARDTVFAATRAARLLYEMGDTDKAKKLLSPSLKRHVRYLAPDDRQKFENFWKELYEEGYVHGQIIRVNSERQFLVIEADSSKGATYIAFPVDLSPGLRPISNELLNKKVRFVPIETVVDNEIKRKATRITEAP